MTIGNLQLAAVGEQDRFLIGNPTISFFRSSYLRYTNFAREWVKISPQGQPRCGSLIPFEIGKSGDMVANVYLALDGPIFTQPATAAPARTAVEHDNFKGSYMPYLGIERVQVSIGGQVVDEMHGDYMQLWSELTKRHSDDSTDTLAQAIHSTQSSGSTIPASNTEEKIYLPLPFWFATNPGLAFPLIALISQKLEISVEFPKLHNEAAGRYGLKDGIWNTAELMVEYVYLDAAERRHFAQDKLEYLITTHQKRVSNLEGSESSKSFELDFFHPVRWFAWGVGAFHQNSNGLTYAFSPSQLVSGALYDTTRITINNQDKESPKQSKFYSLIQPYSCRGKDGNRPWGSGYVLSTSDEQDKALNAIGSTSNTYYGTSFKALPSIYSFSLDITQPVQPMGALNFSRLDSSTLEVRGLFKDVPAATRNAFSTNMIILAESYNILRFQGGMGGLAYQS